MGNQCQIIYTSPSGQAFFVSLVYNTHNDADHSKVFTFVSLYPYRSTFDLISSPSLCSFYQDMAPHLEKGSSVIFITSIAGFQPQGAMAMYGVTKTALLGLTKVCTVSVIISVSIS